MMCLVRIELNILRLYSIWLTDLFCLKFSARLRIETGLKMSKMKRSYGSWVHGKAKTQSCEKRRILVFEKYIFLFFSNRLPSSYLGAATTYPDLLTQFSSSTVKRGYNAKLCWDYFLAASSLQCGSRTIRRQFPCNIDSATDTCTCTSS